jgi:hypothetical protein
VVKKIGNFFSRKILISSLLLLIRSTHGNPSGEEESINPLHISTTTRAGLLPGERLFELRVNYLTRNAGESGAARLVSFRHFSLMSSREPPKLNISMGALLFFISDLRVSVLD